MIGNNELHLNEATMKIALQHWLDSVMHNAPTVAGVTMTDSYGSKTFNIKLEEAPSKEPRT